MAEQLAIDAVATLAAAVRMRGSRLGRGAAARLVLAELERYERAIARWTSVLPTEAQCEAMLEQLLALDERVQGQPPEAGAPASTRPSRRPPATSQPARATTTTTKVPRAASTTKPPRTKTTTKMPRSK